MEKEQAIKIIETLLYMTDHPLTEKEIQQVLGQKEFSIEEIKNILDELAARYHTQNSPLRIVEVAGGVQMATQPEMGEWIRRLYKDRLTVRLSVSALETLAIIAYKQPITRSDIEQIRGVEVSGVMETLLERHLIRVVGRKETIGRPLLYGTTTEFLRQFGLKHLADLPNLNQLAPAPAAPPRQSEDLPLEMQPAPTEASAQPAQSPEPVTQ